MTVAWRLPSFIVTLGMLEMARGAAYLATDSRTQYIGGKIDWLGKPVVAGPVAGSSSSRSRSSWSRRSC